MRQLTFSFPHQLNYSKDSYYIGQSNEIAYKWIKQRFLEQEDFLDGIKSAIITGERFCGKTHLCHVIQQSTPSVRLLNGRMHHHYHPFDIIEKIVIIDDAHQAPEAWLFHLFNHVRHLNHQLLLTSYDGYRPSLKDLSSRLSTMMQLSVVGPDDEMMRHILRKKIDDCGIIVEEDVLSIIIHSIERSYEAIETWVNQLNIKSAEQHKPLTPRFIRSIIDHTI